MDCFNFGEWCGMINDYCGSNCTSGKCGGKSNCFKSSPPKGGNPPSTVTSTYPCTTTATSKTSSTTSASPTSSCPVPTPTGICIQPSSSKYNYGPGNPVGGVQLPVVTCNNIQSDWKHGNVFKLYTDGDSKNCPSYPRAQCGSACSDACKAQFQQCESVYVEGCKTNGQADGKSWGSGYSSKRSVSYFDTAETARRAQGRFGQNYKDADAACKAQLSDCLQTNKNVKDTGKCGAWNSGW
ncbi:Uu.00g005720.m01.CDS01 [Anthostomella pinea]|uniref:Uu.00g005720.m01.CDS01 n=1 Tax=Anthostomella pinea TaxID=933095 RepID=A0AAI8VKT8_9PEZI|nr:Uu.00g005720.m01.CDS01 [Anthostomella pinea]